MTGVLRTPAHPVPRRASSRSNRHCCAPKGIVEAARAAAIAFNAKAVRSELVRLASSAWAIAGPRRLLRGSGERVPAARDRGSPRGDILTAGNESPGGFGVTSPYVVATDTGRRADEPTSMHPSLYKHVLI